jgi:hypothetical protein
MIQRCHNPNNPSFERYGKNGIQVCERWRANFTAFFADMGERPDGTTIDRIDNSRGYEPGNCRWADILTQANNRSSNLTIEVGGRRLTAAQAAKIVGITHQSMISRIAHGTPVMQARRGWLRVGAEYKSFFEWAESSGLPERVIRRRVRLGWEAFRAVSQPVRCWGSLYP